MTGIKNLLKFVKDNMDLLLDNPEKLLKVESLLLKAKDDYDDFDYDNDMGDDDFGHGFSISDDPEQDEKDDAARFLEEMEAANKQSEESSKKEAKEPKEGKKRYGQWKPQDSYSDEHQSAIDDLMEQGYSHREAERMAGAHDGPKNLMDAMNHHIMPSQPSQKMMEQLKALSGEYLSNARDYKMNNADINVNPNLHAEGKMRQARKDAYQDFDSAYSNFINNPILGEDGEELKGRARHKAIKEWKANWKKENPDHDSKVQGLSDKSNVYGEAQTTAKKNLQERMGHIISGGLQSDAYSMQEGIQHAGGVSGNDDSGIQNVSVSSDPTASFALKNPKLVDVLKREKGDVHGDHAERLKRTMSTKIRKKGD